MFYSAIISLALAVIRILLVSKMGFKIRVTMDTEATILNGTPKREQFTAQIPYDIGYVVWYRKNDKAVKLFEFNALVQEVWQNSAFENSSDWSMKNRNGIYSPKIENGKIDILPYDMIKQITQIIFNACAYRGQIHVGAYNGKYDKTAMANLAAFVGKDSIMPTNVVWHDILRSVDNITSSKNYTNFAINNGYSYVSRRDGKRYARKSAETVIRYILRNVEYVEEHTALQDAIDETMVWNVALNRKKKIADEI